MKRIFLFGLLSLLCLPVQSQLLWSISGKNTSHTGYLFGTHHLAEKDSIPHFDEILNVCLSTDAVIGELDLGQPDMGYQIAMGGLMHDQTIRNLVSPSDYALLDSAFREVLGMGMDRLESMKPMMLLSLHQVASFLRQSGTMKQPTAVDEIFQTRARMAGKKVLALETLQQQVDILFNTIPLERQVEALLYTIRNDREMQWQMRELTSAYLKGNLERMVELEKMDSSTTENERKILADNRNLNWIKLLPEMLSKQSCFVAVGCMHLIGETGLVQQLRKLGYTVEPVFFTE